MGSVGPVPDLCILFTCCIFTCIWLILNTALFLKYC